MRLLYPLGDVDLLDAYHLCGGRVVTYRAPSVGHNAHDVGTEMWACHGSRGATSEGIDDNFRGHGNDFLNGAGDRITGRELLEKGNEVGGLQHGICWTV